MQIGQLILTIKRPLYQLRCLSFNLAFLNYVIYVIDELLSVCYHVLHYFQPMSCNSIYVLLKLFTLWWTRESIGGVAVQAIKALTSVAARRLKIVILLLSTLGGPHVSKLIDDLQIHMLIKMAPGAPDFNFITCVENLF